jgi:hypothetical protein
MKRVVLISLFVLLALAPFRQASGQISITVGFAPPALPVYEQPPCPEEGWLWVPGYWGWDADDQDYYWVPGTWVAAPEPGLLWTPAWWGWEDGAFLFHDGFWATEVGWYGGINYGFGYWGHGFWGGRWDHDRFYYNTAVVHVNETVIRNVYIDKTVVNKVTIVNNNHVSYNGGEGGIRERPRPEEERASQGRHFPPARAQEERRQMARSDPQMHASANRGRPPVAATVRPTEFKGSGAVPAREAGAPYHPPANRGGNNPPGGRTAEPGGNRNGPPATNIPGHARDLQPHQAPSPNEQKLIEKENQDHQKLQQKQQKEDQRAQQQQWSQPMTQRLEQKHQQQTQQMEQKHQRQQERARPKENPRAPR